MALSLQLYTADAESSTPDGGRKRGKAQKMQGGIMANVQDEKKPNTSTATNQPNRQETPRPQAAHDTLPDPRSQGRSEEGRDTSPGVGTQIRDKAQEMGTQAQQAVGEYYEQGRESLREMNKSVEEKIREKPLQALLVAGGVGLLLGLLWRRS
jgi:ElaB/YqjD/DUF883 family membrane-anchored ribosome-binding protein